MGELNLFVLSVLKVPESEGEFRLSQQTDYDMCGIVTGFQPKRKRLRCEPPFMSVNAANAQQLLILELLHLTLL